MSAAATKRNGQPLAVWAESLYLINLMLLPGIAFLLLVGLYWRYRHSAPPLARNHLQQTFIGSLWAGALLIAVSAIVIALGGFDTAATWVVVIIYFVTCHAVLVLLGALGLARALSGQMYRFPLLGPKIPLQGNARTPYGRR